LDRREDGVVVFAEYRRPRTSCGNFVVRPTDDGRKVSINNVPIASQNRASENRTKNFFGIERVRKEGDTATRRQLVGKSNEMKSKVFYWASRVHTPRISSRDVPIACADGGLQMGKDRNDGGRVRKYPC